MKKIINGRTYNTDTATELCSRGTLTTINFSDWFETLYITKKGQFFIHYWGGATSKYGESFNNGRSRCEGSGIKLVGKDFAQRFAEKANLDEETYEKYFEVEEG